MTDLRIRRWPLVMMCVTVCAAGTALSWFLGAMAAEIYTSVCSPDPHIERIGRVAGIVGGLLGSGCWCAEMVVLIVHYLRRTGRTSAKLIAWGTFGGHGAALMAAGMVHAWLMIAKKQWSNEGVLYGLSFSAAAGLGLGFVCGLLAWGAGALARPRPAADGMDGRRQL